VWLTKEQRQFVGKDADEFVKRIADDHVRDVTSPMVRSLIGYDATGTLTKIRSPALLLFAERDRKVDPSMSSAIAKAALKKTGRKDWSVEVIAGADHFFEVSGPITRPQERGAEQRLSREFLETLTNWLSKYTSLDKR
jgi:dienelactone hydrolase